MKIIKYKRNRNKWYVFEEGKKPVIFNTEKEAKEYAEPKPYVDFLPEIE